MFRPTAGFLLTIGAVALAAAVRWFLEPWVGTHLPYFALYFAFLLSAWYGGFRLGMLSVLLGLVVGDYLFIEPRFTLWIDGVAAWLDTARYVVVGTSVSLICGSLHAGRARAQAQGELLRVTLASIGDAVITTDEAGNITYLNPVTSAVTGWTPEEARGKPLTEVFRIVNEETRRPVESPATRALRDGVIVGLANHTVLIRKDGSEVPIDDSAAPIRDESGKVSGCVLIFRDVSERRETERRIHRLVGELKESDERKDEFLAILAHELRTPLAPLRNMLEIMKRVGPDAGPVARARDTMDRQLRQMVRLIDDLLDVSRITRNKLELRRERVELASVVSLAIEASRPLADAAGHSLEVELPSEPCWLHADAARLAQVFGNLLHNSCKYTPPGGSIRIAARRNGGAVLVSVRDTGIGIPPDRLDHIFDMFAQVDGTLERSQGGLGIGLTLVKRLVQMHGGSVEAQSEGEGRGAEFLVRLPLDPGAGPSDVRRETVAGPWVGRRVLVVEDNLDSASSLALLLQLTGHEARTAHDGHEALRMMETLRPEVALVDIGLPGLSGLDVCRRAREQPWGRNMVLIALTGWGQDEDRRKSREAGFDGHLVKPVDHGELMTVIEKHAASREGGVGERD